MVVKRLTDKDREVMVKIYKECNVTYDYLAKLFDVSTPTIKYNLDKAKKLTKKEDDTD